MSAAKKSGNAESEARQAFASGLEEYRCPLWGELTEGCTGLQMQKTKKVERRMGKRIAGDCSRKRRFCFSQNPSKAAWYAADRSRRFARRFLQANPSSPSGAKTRSV
jgi:hypothetical protein